MNHDFSRNRTKKFEKKFKKIFGKFWKKFLNILKDFWKNDKAARTSSRCGKDRTSHEVRNYNFLEFF